jgi:hypothetical protein
LPEFAEAGDTFNQPGAPVVTVAVAWNANGDPLLFTLRVPVVGVVPVLAAKESAAGETEICDVATTFNVIGILICVGDAWGASMFRLAV